MRTISIDTGIQQKRRSIKAATFISRRLAPTLGQSAPATVKIKSAVNRSNVFFPLGLRRRYLPVCGPGGGTLVWPAAREALMDPGSDPGPLPEREVTRPRCTYSSRGMRSRPGVLFFTSGTSFPPIPIAEVPVNS